MTEPKFTPAPWIAKGNTLDGFTIREKSSNVIIAETNNYLIQAEANANLISAAPDLYDSLIDILKLWDATIGSEESAVKQSRAAIAKARGESNA